MKKGITFVGMDAHKVAIKLAALLPGETKPVEWQLANEKAAVRRMVKKIQRLSPDNEVRFCYEAGPCGYALLGGLVDPSAPAFERPPRSPSAGHLAAKSRPQLSRAPPESDPTQGIEPYRDHLDWAPAMLTRRM